MDKVEIIPMDKDLIGVLKALIKQNQEIVGINKIIVEHLSCPMAFIQPSEAKER